MADSEDTGKLTAADIAIDALYVIGIAVNVYLIVDFITDGQLSRTVSMKVRTMIGKRRYQTSKEDAIRKESNRVVFEAITIVEGNETE